MRSWRRSSAASARAVRKSDVGVGARRRSRRACVRVRAVVHATRTSLLRGRARHATRGGTASSERAHVDVSSVRRSGTVTHAGARWSGVAPGARLARRGMRNDDGCSAPDVSSRRWTRRAARPAVARARPGSCAATVAFTSTWPHPCRGPSARNAGRDLPRRPSRRRGPRPLATARASSTHRRGAAARPGSVAPMRGAVAGIVQARRTTEGEQVAPAGEVPAPSAADATWCRVRATDGGRGRSAWARRGRPRRPSRLDARMRPARWSSRRRAL